MRALSVEPVPGWAKTLAVVVAIPTAIGLVLIVLAGVFSFASISAELRRTTTFDVGGAPRLQLDVRIGMVVIEAGQAGRIVVEDRREASTVTRAAAADALSRTTVVAERQGDLVTVRQQSPLFDTQPGSRQSTITIRVPVHTDVMVSDLGDVQIQGIDGSVNLQSSGSAELRDLTLRGTSTLSAPVGELTLTNVTVAGSTTVTKRLGEVIFDGQLAPGGSTLDVENDAGNVSIKLPVPTDARATVTAQAGDFKADPAWLFTPDQVVGAHHWTADLAPSPTGRVTVNAALSSVDFGVRPPA